MSHWTSSNLNSAPLHFYFRPWHVGFQMKPKSPCSPSLTHHVVVFDAPTQSTLCEAPPSPFKAVICYLCTFSHQFSLPVIFSMNVLIQPALFSNGLRCLLDNSSVFHSDWSFSLDRDSCRIFTFIYNSSLILIWTHWILDLHKLYAIIKMLKT